MTRKMRVVIFHDYMGTIGGGEKLVLALARELEADIITTDIDVDSIKKMEFEDINIISLGKTIKLPPLKQISASYKFVMCDFSDMYDFFILSGNWAPFAAKRHKPNLLYCHTPVRAFYDLYDVFLQRQSFLSSILFRIWVDIHRRLYEHYITHICKIVANSINTQKRIRQYLNRDSIIIYPPIDVSKFKFEEYGDFWLSVNRLYPEKRAELQIDTFRQIPQEKLLIVGGNADGDHSSSYIRGVLKNLPDNVELLGTVTEKELGQLYGHCKGLIVTAIDEDFGMTPVEAMAAGKQVIGTNEGGYSETIINGQTGLLINPNVQDIVNAINIISKDPSKFKEKCIERSKRFDIENFLDQMKKEIYETYSISISDNSSP